MQRIIGIDYGTIRIGLAISSETNQSAFPLSTITVGDDHSSAIAQIQAQCQEHEVAEVVLGLPLAADGSEGDMARQVKAFGERLRRVGLSVHYIDERFSSQGSAAVMRGDGQSSRKQRQVIDQVAAQQILQTYLDQHGAA